MEDYILEDLSIKWSVLKKLPKGTLLSLVNTEDMDNKPRQAVIVMYTEPESPREIRQSYFCINSGEYLGDRFF